MSEFAAQPAERINAPDPDAWYKATPEHMGDEAYADYRHAIRNPQSRDRARNA